MGSSWRLTIASLWLAAFVLQSALGAVTKVDELELDQFKEIESSDRLTDQQISTMVKEYGDLIGKTLKSEMDELIGEIDGQEAKRLSADKNVDLGQLDKLKKTHETLSKDFKQRIELAGEENKGEMTQSIFGDLGTSKSFIGQIRQRLLSTGSYISEQMGTLAHMAPRVKKQVASIPGKLRRLIQWPNFLSYKTRFNKSYSSISEELYKQMVYTQTLIRAGAHNLRLLLGKTTYLLRPTAYSDMTQKEYHDVVNNPSAEREDDPDAKKMVEMTPEMRQKLMQLAKDGKNIFGQNLDELAERERQKKIAESRKKRSMKIVDSSELDEDEEEDDDDEGDEYEPMDMKEDLSFASGTRSMEVDDSQLGNELDDGKVVDDYVADMDIDANMDDIDNLNDIMDEALNVPTQFKGVDLRKTGCVIQPQPQEGCGACYAYVVTAAASYFNCIQDKGNELVRYNPRFVSDCGRYMKSSTGGINGCRGGKLSLAYKFIGEAGVYPFMEYELLRISNGNYRSDICALQEPESLQSWAPVRVPHATNTRVVHLKLDEVDLHLRTVGPVFVNLRVWDGFPNQGAGIFGGLKEANQSVIHSMWIVGHDKDKHGNDYYIIWNSHGTAWGEGGFVRVYSWALESFKVYIGGLYALLDLERILGYRPK